MAEQMRGKQGETEQEVHIQKVLDSILELPFRAQQGILRTLAPKVIAQLADEERRGFVRDLNEEIRKAERGEPTYDYRPQDQSLQP